MQATLVEKNETTDVSTSGDEAAVYEVGYHLLPGTGGSATDQDISKFRDIITKAGGALITEGTPQKTTLAYPMAVWSNGVWTKHNETYFGWLKFEMSPGSIAQVEQALKEDKAIVRFLVIKTVKEDMRANVRQFVLKEVKRGDSIRSTVKKVATSESKGEKVSDQKLDEVIEEMTAES